MAAGRPSPFSLMKKYQKIKSAERLLCRTGAFPANQGKAGAAKIAPRLFGHPLRKCCMPRSRTALHRFSLISPEAYLLTNFTTINKLVNINPTANKSGQRPAGKPGQGVWPRGRKVFSGLIFWLLFHQGKSNKPFPRRLSGPMLYARDTLICEVNGDCDAIARNDA